MFGGRRLRRESLAVCSGERFEVGLMQARRDLWEVNLRKIYDG